MSTQLLITSAIGLFAIAAVATVARMNLRQKKQSDTFGSTNQSRFQGMSTPMKVFVIIVVIPLVVVGVYVSTHTF